MTSPVEIIARVLVDASIEPNYSSSFGYSITADDAKDIATAVFEALEVARRIETVEQLETLPVRAAVMTVTLNLVPGVTVWIKTAPDADGQWWAVNGDGSFRAEDVLYGVPEATLIVWQPSASEEGKPDIHDLIERSSLGTPEAKALRDSVPIEKAREIVRRSQLPWNDRND